ncbi:uncharacterized protein L3040_006371 [Drepanopeziza brunnea f. sp. 'multigermtubi']|uniref:IdgA domain protein n=1 Tax=Marssonina brunnea f. sp. multigermtubi (strain MB_m1) TaxID=1072389 RepID=K1X6C1_MARBU|nr:IdgA domain protein [Drepanopeziza brunnea f. sp. 'multigermtubi' MB_m1]EKD20647.1 IdgA domain protein [Drepanopeziza brunnea f. sp. 'multigermtubi' MB_m1]KAJ5038691.1 hypothetical protein L3040_006371 [Drepanopeziza brunnea f. sp. 'multigermtubi']
MIMRTLSGPRRVPRISTGWASSQYRGGMGGLHLYTTTPASKKEDASRLPIYQILRQAQIKAGARQKVMAAERAKKKRYFSSDLPVFKVSDEVRYALKDNQPVVALETTIYTHGFPYPDNVALALDLEEIVRKNGAIPATIGVLDGVARVGLSAQEIIELASSAGKPETMKVSRRDLPYVMGMALAGVKMNGGTTVSGTMMLAHRAGIKVFGTGGLGGVHRGAEDSMDISADLNELGRTPVAVISSGCKSFLDIPRTLEYLETQGATVCTFRDGRTGSDIEFPAFYTRESGIKSHALVRDARDAAAIIYSQEILGHYSNMHSGMLFANPIPKEFALPKEEIDAAIEQAVKEAAEQGFHGAANTPFILARIKDLTEGNSLPANRALVESNVTMAARVAKHLAIFRSRKNINQEFIKHVEKKSQSIAPEIFESIEESVEPAKKIESPAVASFVEPGVVQTSKKSHSIYVLGSVAMDLSCDYIPLKERGGSASDGAHPESPRLQTSNIATIIPSIGGVGHNVALAAHRASGSSSVQLRSFIGDDLAGKTVLAALAEEGLDSSGIATIPAGRTAQYVAVNDGKKDLVLAMADMNLFATESPQTLIMQRPPSSLKWAVVDANWQRGSIRKIISHYHALDAHVAFEPVSVAKSAGLFEPDATADPAGAHTLQPFPANQIDLATPNQHELAAMHAAARKHGHFDSDAWWKTIDALGIPSSGARDRLVSITNPAMADEGIPQQAIQLLPLIPTILTKLGADGVLVTELLRPGDSRLFDPAHAPYILSRCSNGTASVGGVYMRLFPAVEAVQDVVSVNGVGDTFLGVLVAGLAKGLKLDAHLIDIAQRGAVMTLRSKESVSPHLGALSAELDALSK